MPGTEVDKTPQGPETTVEEEIVQDSGRSLEGKRDMRLMILLRELVEENGGRKTAKALGVSYRSMSRAFEAGLPNRRLRDALERHLLMGGGAAAARQRETVQTLQQRMDALESKVGDSDIRVEELVKALRVELKELREALEEQSEAVILLERRTNRRDAGRGAKISNVPEVGERPTGPSPRVYRELVTLEHEAGEEDVYGEAAALVAEWRLVRVEVLAGGGSRSAKRSVDRLRELEVALIGEYGLTLPPALHPWDRYQRRDELERRTRAMGDSRREGFRAQVIRWLRRVLAGG